VFSGAAFPNEIYETRFENLLIEINEITIKYRYATYVGEYFAGYFKLLHGKTITHNNIYPKNSNYYALATVSINITYNNNTRLYMVYVSTDKITTETNYNLYSSHYIYSNIEI